MSAEYLVTFCDMLQRWDRLPDAKKIAAGLVAMYPDFGPGWMKYVELCEPEDPIRFASHAVKLAPERYDLKLKLAEVAIAGGDTKLARNTLQNVVAADVDPWSGRARVMLAKRFSR